MASEKAAYDIDLQSIQRRHNLLRLLGGVGMLLLSGALWVISYWAFKVLLVVPTFMFDIHLSRATVSLVALGCTALLAFEGFRYGKQVFDLQAYHDSWYYQWFRSVPGSGSGSASRGADGGAGPPARDLLGNPLRIPWLISQFLFCAPRSTVKGVRLLRSLVFFSADVLGEARHVVGELDADWKWVPVADFGEYGKAIVQLHRLGIIQSRTNEGLGEMRLDRDFRSPPTRPGQRPAQTTLP